MKVNPEIEGNETCKECGALARSYRMHSTASVIGIYDVQTSTLQNQDAFHDPDWQDDSDWESLEFFCGTNGTCETRN